MISGLTSTSKKKGRIHMPRFIPTRSGAGIPAIQETAKKRIVATFFSDKEAPDAAENMLKVCCDALNAVAPTAPTPKAARERCGK